MPVYPIFILLEYGVMKHFYIIFLIIASFGFKIKIVEDIIQRILHANNISLLSFHGCNLRDTFHLVKTFSKKGYRINFVTESYNGSSYGNTLLILNLDCESSRNIISMGQKMELFSAPNYWLLYYNEQRSRPEYFFRNYLEVTKDISFNSKTKIIFAEILDSKSILKRLYRAHKSEKFITEDIDEKSHENPSNFRNYAIETHKKVRNTQLSAIILTMPDRLYRQEKKRILKIDYAILMTLVSAMNATLQQISIPMYEDDLKSSYQQLLRLINEDKYDVVGSSIFMDEEAVDFVDFVAPSLPIVHKFIFQEPKLSQITDIYSKPFINKVWCIITLLSLLALICLLIVMKWENSHRRTQSFGRKEAFLEASWWDIGFFIYTHACQQSSHVLPYSYSGRMIVFFVTITYLFLQTSYSAIILTLLNSYSGNINTLQDLLDSPLEIGITCDELNEKFYFQNLSENLQNILFKKVTRSGDNFECVREEEGLNRVRNEAFAFHVSVENARQFIGSTYLETEKCRLSYLPFRRTPINNYYPISKTSEYKKLIQFWLRRMTEVGIFNRESKKYGSQKPACTTKGFTFVSVGLTDCKVLIYIIIAGVFFSLLLCIFENIIHYMDTLKWLLKFSAEGYPGDIITAEKMNAVKDAMQTFVVFIVNLSCTNVTSILQMADRRFLFMPPYRWMLYYNLTHEAPGEIVSDFFQDYSFQLNSDVTLLGYADNYSPCRVDKIYRIKNKYEIVLENVGYFSTQKSFQKDFLDKSLGKYRQNLEGRRVKSILFLHDMKSVKHLTDKREKFIDSKAKVDYALAQLLADSLNATLDCEMAYIYDYSVGNWTLPTYSLHRGVDFAASGLAISALQLVIVDFLDGTSYLRYRLLLEQPKLSTIANLYVLPFTPHVWYTMMILLLGIVAVIYSIKRWEIKKYNMRDFEEKVTWFETAFTAFTDICKQGSSEKFYSVSGRIAAIVMLIYVVFMHVSYSANITSLLNSSKNYIEYLEDLLKFKIRIYMDASGYYIYSLENQTGTITERIVKERADPVPMEIDQGIHKLQESETGYLTCIDDILPVVDRTFSENEKCRLSELDLLGSPQAWLTIPKNSTLKETIKLKMKKIIESGLRKREFKLLYSEKPECLQNSVFVDVSLQDCYPAFAAFLVGLILAIIVFFIEIFDHFYKK